MELRISGVSPAAPPREEFQNTIPAGKPRLSARGAAEPLEDPHNLFSFRSLTNVQTKLLLGMWREDHSPAMVPLDQSYVLQQLL